MYEVKVGLTGDAAEAETWEAALVAAAQLVRDDADANPYQGRTRAARASILVTEDGSYRGILTELAKSGIATPARCPFTPLEAPHGS